MSYYSDYTQRTTDRHKQTGMDSKHSEHCLLNNVTGEYLLMLNYIASAYLSIATITQYTNT